MLAPVAGRRLFTADEYQRMAQAGIFDEDNRIELIEGVVVKMAAIGSEHGACVARSTDAFERITVPRIIRWVQSSIRLSDGTEPQPDIALLRYRADYYRTALPVPTDVLLLLEVADTTLAYDRRVKMPLYAAAKIPEVWIANLNEQTIEVYRQPHGDRFELVTTHRRGATLTPVSLPEFSVRVEELLGEEAAANR